MNNQTSSPRSLRRQWLVRLISLAGIGLLASGGWWLHAANTPERDSSNQRVLPVTTQTLAQTSSYERQRTFLGEVRARRTSMLGFELPGALAEVRVDEGDRVAAGQVLATLDTQRLAAARAEAEAGLREATAAEELARSTLARLERARAANAVSEQQVDESARQVDRQAAAAARAQAQVDRLEVDIAKSQLVAPFDGQLQRRFVDEGTVVPAGQPVFELRESGSTEIRFSVEGALIRGLTLGSTLQGRTRDGSEISLRITRILPGRDPGTRAVPVFAEAETSAIPLQEGELIEVVLNQNTARDGFWIPITALAESARGLWSCYVAEPDNNGQNHQLVRREVEILSLREDRAYVAGNLRDGEELVVDGLHRIVPGQTVRLAANR